MRCHLSYFPILFYKYLIFFKISSPAMPQSYMKGGDSSVFSVEAHSYLIFAFHYMTTRVYTLFRFSISSIASVQLLSWPLYATVGSLSNLKIKFLFLYCSVVGSACFCLCSIGMWLLLCFCFWVLFCFFLGLWSCWL